MHNNLKDLVNSKLTLKYKEKLGKNPKFFLTNWHKNDKI